jgi:hypothetical protein
MRMEESEDTNDAEERPRIYFSTFAVVAFIALAALMVVRDCLA